jgi:DNA-binding HxlR family transcriptional regulator
VVGDRWNLLIVRQLLLAPARYRELLDGLPGVATNLLTDRLRDLQTAGVVERRLAEESNAIVYALTPWGAELREPIEGLARWSTPLMTSGPGGDRFRTEWLVLACTPTSPTPMVWRSSSNASQRPHGRSPQPP